MADVFVPPEWASGNEPEYSRADLHQLDAVLCNGAQYAAARPALIDLIKTAETNREVQKVCLTVLCAARISFLGTTLERDVAMAIGGLRGILNINPIEASGAGETERKDDAR